ncbi:hypothetical protein ACLKA7_004047 [Drosophila subpalustris]
MQTLSESLKSIFTESQVRKLQNGGKRIKWNQDDITYASCLHAAGPRAYRHLLKKGFPLPCQSTLEKWLHSIEVKPGILELVIGLMEKAVNIDEDDKICILSFDEMRITSSCETDSSQGGVQQPRDYVQVAMAQGLRKSWKQPIFFDFDKAMTVPTLHMLIQKLYTIGYHVVGIVSDMCPTNLRLWTNLGVSHERTWFKHPSDSDMKVFVFADAAHLLKLIRNHFLDSGLLVGDKVITQQTVRQVMSHASLSEISSEQINKCPHCGQYFIDSDELVEHIRIHTGERTYSCTECSKEFGYAWQLETHIRKHTGEQPFKCPHCSQTCKNSKDLIKHIESSHSRQRLHKCPQCPKAFISVSNFKEHIKSHCMKNP